MSKQKINIPDEYFEKQEFLYDEDEDALDDEDTEKPERDYDEDGWS